MDGDRGRIARVCVVVLVVVGTLSFSFAAVGWWGRRNLANTDVWMERVGPLADDPDVQAALATWLTGQVVELVDPAERLAEVLPERTQILAVPLSGAVEDFIHSRIARFLESDRFEQLWIEANELVHPAVIRVLRGESEAVRTRGGRVSINLVPVIDAALADLGSASPEVFGREVDLPDLTAEEIPAAAVERLEDALGVQLDDDFGQFVVYDGGRLAALQDGVQQARRLLVVASVTSVVCMALAVALSHRRRRTLLQVLAGLAIGLVVIRRLGLRGQRELLAAITDDSNRAAADAASHRFLDPLLAVTQTLLVGLALVAVVTVLTGPYPWAVRLRGGTARFVRHVADVQSDGAAGEWIADRRSALQLGAAAVAVVAVLLVDVSFLGLLVVGLALVAAEIYLDRAGRGEVAAGG